VKFLFLLFVLYLFGGTNCAILPSCYSNYIKFVNNSAPLLSSVIGCLSDRFYVTGEV
jgi:hypothetical protein